MPIQTIFAAHNRHYVRLITSTLSAVIRSPIETATTDTECPCPRGLGELLPHRSMLLTRSSQVDSQMRHFRLSPVVFKSR